METSFKRINCLPPYVFSIMDTLKKDARARGVDIIDFGMGNPDQPTPPPIVDKLIETARRGDTHRYSLSRGIPRLRQAITDWYARRYQVRLDPHTEAIVTLGSKEGLAHLALACTGPGDTVLVPSPAYPIHTYGFIIAGAKVHALPLYPHPEESAFFETITAALRSSQPVPKMLVLNFPSNPTTHCVELAFFEKIIALAKQYNIWVIQDLAYADLVFDGYQAPSILQVPGAKDIAVEFFTLSKSYNMPGWRVGFCCGNMQLIAALAKLKSYLDYGMFTPIQVAAITALESNPSYVHAICARYQNRRDILCEGLKNLGWPITPPRATMFVWAPIPRYYRHLGALAFSKKLLQDAHVAVSPGIGFGEHGEGYVRFSLIENAHRTRQALRNIRKMMQKDGFITDE